MPAPFGFAAPPVWTGKPPLIADAVSRCLFSLLGLLLAACVMRYPLGMTEAEWLALPPEKQMKARHTQAKLDAQAAERRSRRQALAAEQRAKATRQRQADINALYARGRYRDFIQCIVKRPLIDFRPGWKEMRSIGFVLARREDREIFLETKNGLRRASIWAFYSDDGIKVTLCRKDPRNYNRNQCDSLVATHLEYERGVRKSINMPDRMQGTLECTFAPGRGMHAPRRRPRR